MKTFYHHRCDRRHRTYSKFVSCVFRVWPTGEGEYAVIIWCRTKAPYWYTGGNEPSVHLYETLEEAQNSPILKPDYVCGGVCKSLHEIVRLGLAKK